MPRFVTVLVVAALVGLPADMSAQRVIGLVADSGSSAPIAGAVVAALDSAGGLVGARTLSDAAGRFVLLVSSRVTRSANRADRIPAARDGNPRSDSRRRHADQDATHSIHVGRHASIGT